VPAKTDSCCASQTTDEAPAAKTPVATSLVVSAQKCRGESGAFATGGLLMHPPAARVDIARPERRSERPPVDLHSIDGLADLEPGTPPPRATS
jgi:hypothetical protein